MAETETEALRKRILYRCKQRGLRELDLVMGAWAEERLPGMGREELELAERISLVESPTLLKWYLGKEKIPDEARSDMLDDLLAYRLHVAASK